ncbi:MAG TPA: hypothetical protein VI039_07535 [Solirubrobacterales bacterium]
MKYLKLLALSGAMMATMLSLAGNASATSVVSPVTGIKGESEEAVTLYGSTNVSCASSSFSMNIENSGPGVTASGKLTSLAFSECSGGDVTVQTRGSLEIHALGSGDGTVTWSNGRILVLHTTPFGINVECDYGSSGTHLGTIDTNVFGTATLDWNITALPVVEGNFLCGSSVEWIGSYILTPTVADTMSIV